MRYFGTKQLGGCLAEKPTRPVAQFTLPIAIRVPHPRERFRHIGMNKVMDYRKLKWENAGSENSWLIEMRSMSYVKEVM